MNHNIEVLIGMIGLVAVVYILFGQPIVIIRNKK